MINTLNRLSIEFSTFRAKSAKRELENNTRYKLLLEKLKKLEKKQESQYTTRNFIDDAGRGQSVATAAGFAAGTIAMTEKSKLEHTPKEYFDGHINLDTKQREEL